ncbi:hypothetical protein VNO78_03248 [Psophocarpus tetragonolobus]|uniref:Uncharacterized protein n=1 Tax=Psophocarpus tetragonolobus TaxID=3891 RepID=A0AAN9T038_PSOTE
MMKTSDLPFWCGVAAVVLLALDCAAEEASTIIFNTVNRAHFNFDIYSLPIQQQSLTPHQEIKLTDGHSVNFNGHFLSNSSAIQVQLPTHSPPLQLVYVSERDGFPTIYYDAVYASSRAPPTRRSALQTPIADRVQMPLLPNIQISMQDKPNVSPDGQYLVYVSTHQDPGIPRASWAAVYSTHLQSGLTQRLTPQGIADFSPALSPSGLFTAVASYGSPDHWDLQVADFPTDIYVFLTRDGTHRVKVAENGGWPAWLDDRTLLFHRRGHDQWWSIYKATLTPDSVRIERVTPPGLHAFTPATSPGNNKFIAVATRRPGSSFRHIELFNLVNNEFTELTRFISPHSHHLNPFLSPDSSLVGYHKCRGEPDNHSSPPLLLENIRSPIPRVSLFRFVGEFPSFSPSGERIVYTGPPGVYVVNSDGSNLREVLPDPAFSTAWDPVRASVVYAAVGKSFGFRSSRVDIMSINVDEGNRVKRLTAKSNNAFPSLSPDGKWIVFRSARSGAYNLYIMDAVEGEKKELRRLTEGGWNDTMCAWSPSGEWIVFSSNREMPDTSKYELYLIHPNGTGLRKLYESLSDGKSNHPSFSPDGNTVIFSSDYAGPSAEPISNPDNALPYGELFSVRLDGSALKRITHNSYEDGTVSWSTRYLHPFHVKRPNPEPFCSFKDVYFLKHMPNTSRVPVSKPSHCVI